MKKQIGWDVVTLFQMCRSKDNNRPIQKKKKLKYILKYIKISFTLLSSTYYKLMELNIYFLYQR
jgi:hypothetical protein